jgi:coenzyme F420-reducing hydrogenase beta subunit
LVLFTGTPCQAAGLRSFIGTHPDAKNLYIADVICYGIPSPLIWQEYLQYLENKYDDKIQSVEFRSKIFGWNRENSGKNFMFTTKNSGKTHISNDYYSLFFSARTIMRPSCYQCKFTDHKRPSDITIADYWGIEKYAPEFANTEGVSLLLINSAKGKLLFEYIKNDFEYIERPANECLSEQPRLSRSVKLPEIRSHAMPHIIQIQFALYVVIKSAFGKQTFNFRNFTFESVFVDRELAVRLNKNAA